MDNADKPTNRAVHQLNFQRGTPQHIIIRSGLVKNCMGKIVIPRELPDTAAILHSALRLEQGDMSVFGHTPENQALTHQGGNLFWREVDHGNDLFPWKLLYLIEVGNLCGGLSLAQSPKVNNQL